MTYKLRNIMQVSDSILDNHSNEMAIIWENNDIPQCALDFLHACGFTGNSKLIKLFLLIVNSSINGKPIWLMATNEFREVARLTAQVCQLMPQDFVEQPTTISEGRTSQNSRPPAASGFIFIDPWCEANTQELKHFLQEPDLAQLASESINGTWGHRAIGRKPAAVIVANPELYKQRECTLHNFLFLNVGRNSASGKDVLKKIAQRAMRDEFLPAHVLRVVSAHFETSMQAETIVLIPFADLIADRMSGDIPKADTVLSSVLSLIETHALLHYRLRAEEDDDYEIMATIEDYRAVHELSDMLKVDPIYTQTLQSYLPAPEQIEQLIEGREAECDDYDDDELDDDGD